MKNFEILKYYSQERVQEALLKAAKDREAISSLEDGAYLRRPDVLLYPRDILERVKRGAVSFHYSVERWHQPMQLSAEMPQRELSSMRKGWDFVLDIDSKVRLEHAKIAVRVVYDFLKDLGVEPTVKFSGRRGFHVAIAAEAFPKSVDFSETAKRYPEMPQILVSFIREKIKDTLLDALIAEEGGVAALTRTLAVSRLSPYEFIEFEKNWGNRHLFRAPYSLHEKSWLVSLPLDIKQIEKFRAEDASPQKVEAAEPRDFLVNKNEEATELLLQALDWNAKQKVESIAAAKKTFSVKAPVDEQFFPPCIKNILSGLSDGRKRSLFTLITFLQNMNWTAEKIEPALQEWNSRNASPLPERMLRTQLKWHLRQSRKILPANCSSELFYKSLDVCKREANCGKNPVNYAFKLFLQQQSQHKRKKGLKG